MARTPRPQHRRAKRHINLIAQKMANATMRNGRIGKDDIEAQYRRLVNCNGANDDEVREVAAEVAAAAAAVHPQVKLERDGSLQWYTVGRGVSAAAVMA